MFKFGAEKVLDLRLSQEKKAMEQLGLVRKKINELRDKIGDKEAENNRAFEYMNSHRNIEILRTGFAFDQHIREQIQEIETQIEALKPLEESALASLRKAITQRKAMEKLKEIRKSEYMAELKKKERKKLEEVVNVKFVMNSLNNA